MSTTDAAIRIQRVSVVAVCGLIFGMVVVLARVTQLQIAPSQNLLDNAPRLSSIRTDSGRRGNLYDRRGRLLATSRFGWSLFADPSILEDIYNVAVTLGERLDINPVTLDKRLQPRLGTQYANLVPLLTDVQVEAWKSGPAIQGVGLKSTMIRDRPFGDVGASFIGEVRLDSVGPNIGDPVDHIGISGMELILNKPLMGKEGSLHYLRDGKRNAMWVQPAGYSPTDMGQNYRLSIDIEIQKIIEDELATVVESVNASGGRLIVLDPSTGEFLAIADIIRKREGFEPIAVDPARKNNPAMGRIRSVSDPYEPGSTFKPFVWAVGTELGLMQPEDVLDTHNGYFRTTQGRRIRDAHGYESLSWEGVLIKSSNIGMAQVAELMTDMQMQNVIKRFGFGERTACGLPGETAGIVTPPDKWTHYSQTSVAFGHEIAVTPLQMVRAFSAFARDGTIPTLQTTAVMQSHDDSQTPRLRAIVERRAIPESIALQTRVAMRKVMLEGSGRRAEEGAMYTMFGKSGTAQLPNRKEGGYYEDRYIISFIAGAPYDNPRLVVLCIVEDPDRSINHWGGAVCGPVVRNVMNRVLSYMGVHPDINDPSPILAEAE